MRNILYFLLIMLCLNITFVIPKYEKLLNISFTSSSVPDEIHANNLFINYPDNSTARSVVKLNFLAQTPLLNLPVQYVATGFSVRYNEDENISFIITNDHFCTYADEYPDNQIFYEESNHSFSQTTYYPAGFGVVINTNPELDLCIIVVDGFVKPVKFENKEYIVTQTERVSTIGAPHGMFPIYNETFITGLIERDGLGLDITPNGEPIIMISQIVFPGQSGSPIFNKHDKVIGIIFANQKKDDNSNLLSTYGGCVFSHRDIINYLESINLMNL